MKKMITLIAAGIALSASAFAETDADRPERPGPAKFSAKLIAKFDTDGSATLDEAELAEALVFIRQNRPGPGKRQDLRQRREPPPPEKVAQRMLDKHDANGDTLLSREELVEALANMPRRQGRKGPPPPPQG